MATTAPISDLNSDMDRLRTGERMEREYSRVPFLARTEWNPKLGQVVYGENYLGKTKRWVEQVIEDAKSKALQDPEIKNLSRYIDLVMGKHWTGQAPSWRRRPVVNKIAKHFWDNLAMMADLKFAIDIVTSSGDPKFQIIASNLTKLAQSNFEANDGIAAVLYCSQYASLSSGYLKITRDRLLRDITYTPLGPDACVQLLPNVFDLQKSGGVIHRMMQPMSWFETHHPKVARLIKPQRPPADPYAGTSAMSLGATTYSQFSGRLEMGASGLLNASTDQFSVQGFATEEGSPYDEIHFRDPQVNRTQKSLWMGFGNWTYEVKPGKPLYPYGRMISVAGEADPVILWDGPNMHWHGMYPFAWLRSKPVFWMLSGISDLRDLVPINSPYNRVLGDCMILIEQAMKPTVVTREGALPKASWDEYMPGSPGGKIKLLNRLQGILEQIAFIHPPVGAIPAATALLGILSQEFNNQSGQGSGRQLSSKKQVPGAEAVHLIQESEQGPYRVKGTFFELFFKQVGRLVMSDVCQFWDPDKVVSVLGPDDETWQYLEVEPGGLVPQNVREGDFPTGNKFVSQFNVMMTAGSSLPAKRREQASLAMALAATGRLDGESLFKKLNATGAGLPAWSEVKKRLAEDHAAGIGVAPPKKGQVRGAAQAAIPQEGS